MDSAYRVCPSCGDANEVRAYDCIACGFSLSGTIPGPLRKGVQIAVERPSESDGFLSWATEVESGIARDETYCHQCLAHEDLLQFPFALANLQPQLSRWYPRLHL